MISLTEFNLPILSPYHKQRMLVYAQQVLEAQQQMVSSTSQNILQYLLKKKSNYLSLSHYPKGDRIDYTSGAQYFYHCHRENYDSTEHGHFHCFIRYPQIPKTIKPAQLADWDIYIENPMTHLVAIAMNQLGQPIRLFTVNRWVTSEIWYDASAMRKLVKRFTMNKTDNAYWQVLDKWTEGMIHLFAPQIHWLLEARDEKVQAYKAEQQVANPLIDQDLEELSEVPIDLTRQIEWLIA